MICVNLFWIGESIAVCIRHSRVSASSDCVLDGQAVLWKVRRQRPGKVVIGITRLEGRHSAALDSDQKVDFAESIGGAEITDIDCVRLVMRQYHLACQRLIRIKVRVKADVAILHHRVAFAVLLDDAMQDLASPVVRFRVQVSPAKRDCYMAGGILVVAEVAICTSGSPRRRICGA